MTTLSLDPTLHLELGAGAAGASPAENIVRFSAADLFQAQQQYARLKADHPDARVFVDLDVHIAVDARTARRELLASSEMPRDGVLQYVGTAAGLAGLIADILAVDVADGVTVRPVIARFEDAVVTSLTADVVPALAVRRVRAS